MLNKIVLFFAEFMSVLSKTNFSWLDLDVIGKIEMTCYLYYNVSSQDLLWGERLQKKAKMLLFEKLKKNV